MSLSRRALKEIQKARSSDEYDFFMDDMGVYITDERGNCYLRWTPESGLYQGQTHILKIRLVYGSNVVKTYPRNPPNVTFITPIWHTNVGTGGAVCLDVLKEGSGPQSWSPMSSLEAVLSSIQLLMEEHNPSSPMNGDAGNMYNVAKKEKNNMETFKEYARNYYNKQLNKLSPEHTLKRLLDAPEFLKEEKENKDKSY